MRDFFSKDDEPIRVFVAATPAEWLPMRVLEFSIRETSPCILELVPLYTFSRPIPVPNDLQNRPRTPFSFQRFLIPELCDFQGKAIYLDADMQVFKDIRGLWSQDLINFDLQAVQDGNDGRRSQFSVMLLNCEKLNWNIDQIVSDLDVGRLNYDQLMYEMKLAPNIGQEISPEWNALERYEVGKTCLLHYTDMNTQPWISTNNPLGHLWVACLQRALEAGFIGYEELNREINSGHVRPSLLAQIESGIQDCISLPAAIRKLDRGYLAPYRFLRCGKSSPWLSLGAAIFAFLRSYYYRTVLVRIFG